MERETRRLGSAAQPSVLLVKLCNEPSDGVGALVCVCGRARCVSGCFGCSCSCVLDGRDGDAHGAAGRRNTHPVRGWLGLGGKWNGSVGSGAERRGGLVRAWLTVQQHIGPVGKRLSASVSALCLFAHAGRDQPNRHSPTFPLFSRAHPSRV